MTTIDLTDINLIYLPMPLKMKAAVTPNDDGSHTIVLNTRLPEAEQQKSLLHELDHIRRGEDPEESADRIEVESRKPQQASISHRIARLKPVIPEHMDDYETFRTKVVGVTFATGDRLRQDMLRELKNDMEQGTYPHRYGLQTYMHESGHACYVIANDNVIGNIPMQLVGFVISNFNRIEGVNGFSIYGGRDGKSLGCEISFLLRRNSE